LRVFPAELLRLARGAAMRLVVCAVLIPSLALLASPANSQTTANNCEAIEGVQNKAACFAQGGEVVIDCAVPRDVDEASLCRGAFANDFVRVASSTRWLCDASGSQYPAVETCAMPWRAVESAPQAPPHIFTAPMKTSASSGKGSKVEALTRAPKQTFGKCHSSACRSVQRLKVGARAESENGP
jgi:hypothetical protein